MDGLELASVVSTKEVYEVGDANAPFKVAVMDYGVKQNILNCLLQPGRICKSISCKNICEELKEFNPDGYFISNGPGDPAAMAYAIDTVKEIIERRKTFVWDLSGSPVTGTGQ